MLRQRQLCSASVRAVGAILLTLLCGTGCFQTEYSLDTEANAAVNLGYVGTFTGQGGGKNYTMVVRNVDNKHYWIEWTSEDLSSPGGSFFAYTTPVRGVVFAHLRLLTADGSIRSQQILVRADLSSDRNTVTLRHLRSNFFGGVDSDAALRARVVEGIGDQSMYENPIVMSRAKSSDN